MKTLIRRALAVSPSLTTLTVLSAVAILISAVGIVGPVALAALQTVVGRAKDFAV